MTTVLSYSFVSISRDVLSILTTLIVCIPTGKNPCKYILKTKVLPSFHCIGESSQAIKLALGLQISLRVLTS